jgi:hypothetical protein
MLSGLFKSLIFVKFSIDSNPKKGMAITSDNTRNARKLAIIINNENMNCERGFISRKAVNAIFVFCTKIEFL